MLKKICWLFIVVFSVVVLPVCAQNVTVPLPGATAVTGVLSGTTLSLVERTVPAGYMEPYPAFDGSYRNPVVVVEGFDPQNRTSPASVYATGNAWGILDIVRAAGRSVWIVNFGDGGGALTANAKLVSAAIQTAANYGGLSNAKVDRQDMLSCLYVPGTCCPVSKVPPVITPSQTRTAAFC